MWKSCSPLKTQPERRSARGESRLIQRRRWTEEHPEREQRQWKTEWDIYSEELLVKKGAYLQQRGYSKPSQSPWGENNLTFSAERPELRTNAPVQGVSTFTHGPLEMRGFTHEENAALLLHSPQVLERELIIWSFSTGVLEEWTHRALCHMFINIFSKRKSHIWRHSWDLSAVLSGLTLQTGIIRIVRL